MFKAGQVWYLNGVPEFRVVFVQPSDWNEMRVEFIKSGIYQDVAVDDFADVVNNYDYTVKEE